MKRVLSGIIIFVFALSSLAFAELKIGIVDMQKALDECDAGKNASKKIEQAYKEMQQKIQKKREELQQMQSQLNSQSGVLSDKAKEDKMNQYQDRLKKLKRMVEDSNNKLKREERSYVNDIAEEMTGVVKKLGKELGYDIVMEKREAGVVFNSKAVDITPIVVERYNKIWNSENN